MNIFNFDNHLFSQFVIYLSMDDMFAVVETCKIFYYNIKNFLQLEIKQPSVYHIVGSINLLEWAKSHSNFRYSCEYTQMAARRDDFEILKYLVRDGCKIHINISIEAVKNNNFQILKYAVKRNLYSNETLNMAASENNIKMMKFLMKNNCFADYNICNYAAYYGGLEALKWLIEDKNCELCDNIYDYACASGNIKLLNYLYKYTACDLSMPYFSSKTLKFAAEAGHLRVIKWLIKKKCPMDYDATLFAANNNRAQCLKFLIDNKCPVQSELFYKLSEYGLNYNINNVNII